MRFLDTHIPGVKKVTFEKKVDERGYFARIFDEDIFREAGLVSSFPQHSLSFNANKGTLRGMHYQLPPAAETKLVRCVQGSIFDVVVDVREDSPTYLQHWSGILSSANLEAVYIPTGCAHGFITLEDASCVLYQINGPYTPELARGLKWDDPKLAIQWPEPVTVISEKDTQYQYL